MLLLAPRLRARRFLGSAGRSIIPPQLLAVAKHAGNHPSLVMGEGGSRDFCFSLAPEISVPGRGSCLGLNRSRLQD